MIIVSVLVAWMIGMVLVMAFVAGGTKKTLDEKKEA